MIVYTMFNKLRVTFTDVDEEKYRLVIFLQRTPVAEKEKKYE